MNLLFKNSILCLQVRVGHVLHQTLHIRAAIDLSLLVAVFLPPVVQLHSVLELVLNSLFTQVFLPEFIISLFSNLLYKEANGFALIIFEVVVT